RSSHAPLKSLPGQFLQATPAPPSPSHGPPLPPLIPEPARYARPTESRADPVVPPRPSTRPAVPPAGPPPRPPSGFGDASQPVRSPARPVRSASFRGSRSPSGV